MTPTTPPVLPGLCESTRKTGARIEGEILRRLSEATQAHAATCMGVSASTVSRLAEHIGGLSQLLAAIGLQVAPSNAVVVDEDDQRALKRFAFLWLKAEIENEALRMAKGRE